MSYLSRIPIPLPQSDAYAEFTRARQVMLWAFNLCVAQGLPPCDSASEIQSTRSAMAQIARLKEII
jgi:hypothetical protein